MSERKASPIKKKSFLRKNRDLLLVFLIFTPVYYLHVLTQPVSPFLPREESFAPYERHYHVGINFPFVTTYFLMVPENYQPENYKYPLVLMLHGVSQHMYGGKVLADPDVRAALPVFALIPIAPFGFAWAVPKKISLRPQAIPIAMDVLRSVQKKYNINDDQIYITGYSMGGLGTYGALSKYHGVFAAAAPTDAGWNLELADKIDDIPIWVFHGANDTEAPVQYGRSIVAALKQAGRDVRYTEIPQQGHGAWEKAYDDPDFWYWMVQQKKK